MRAHDELEFEPLQAERAGREQNAIYKNGSKHGGMDFTRDAGAECAQREKGVLVTRRLVLAILTLAIASAVTAADDSTQRVLFEPGKTSVTLNGTVTGYRSLRYIFAARTGQILSIGFVPSKDSLYYNVLRATHVLHDGSSDEAHEWTAPVAADGDYVVDVYLKSSDARKNAQATFILSITATNPAVNYLCADGRSITVTYVVDPDPGSATVVVAGKSYELPHVVSGSGARYATGKITWWNKGREGTLELNGPATQCSE
jgi:membrane-bound inhibitor of C-type lysozyme